MRSRVQFPVLPWEFFLKGRIPTETMVWEFWQNLGLRALLALHPPVSPLTSSGQRNCASGRPNLRSRLHCCHARREGHEVHKDMWWHWTKNNFISCIRVNGHKSSPVPVHFSIRQGCPLTLWPWSWTLTV